MMMLMMAMPRMMTSMVVVLEVVIVMILVMKVMQNGLCGVADGDGGGVVLPELLLLIMRS